MVIKMDLKPFLRKNANFGLEGGGGGKIIDPLAFITLHWYDYDNYNIHCKIKLIDGETKIRLYLTRPFHRHPCVTKRNF